MLARYQKIHRGHPETMTHMVGLLLALVSVVACAEKTPDGRWKEFMTVAGQPEPVPVQWVSTPEGKLAHSVVIPNPVPKDSGYRRGMSSKAYFDHLCKTEAGEFIFKTAEKVEGFYFVRPPKRPTDEDLKDRYKLEAPDIERTFQLMRDSTAARARIFIGPPYNLFKYVEERARESSTDPHAFVIASGYKGGVAPMQIAQRNALTSTHGLIWRGVRRSRDRELGIAGGEWIVFELKTEFVIGVLRNYSRTGSTRGFKESVWWLNAASCPVFAGRYKHATSEKIYDFVSKVLNPN